MRQHPELAGTYFNCAPPSSPQELSAIPRISGDSWRKFAARLRTASSGGSHCNQSVCVNARRSFSGHHRDQVLAGNQPLEQTGLWPPVPCLNPPRIRFGLHSLERELEDGPIVAGTCAIGCSVDIAVAGLDQAAQRM